MIHRAGDAEADVQLRLHHDAGLADLQLIGQDSPVIERSRAADLAAQKPGQGAIALQVFGILQTVAHTDDAVCVGDIHLRVGLIRNKVDVSAADCFRGKADLLTDLLDLLFFPCRGVLEGTWADGAYLGPQNRNRNHRHDLAADGRLNELNVAGLGVVLQLHRIRGAAGLQLYRKARCKITAVDGTAHKNGGRFVLSGQHREGVGIGIGIEVFVPGAADVNNSVNAALLHLFHLCRGKFPEDHGIEPVSRGVAELSQFAAQLQAHRRRGHTVVLDIHPHVPVIGFLHLHHLLRSHLFPPEASGARRRRSSDCRSG